MASYTKTRAPRAGREPEATRIGTGSASCVGPEKVHFSTTGGASASASASSIHTHYVFTLCLRHVFSLDSRLNSWVNTRVFVVCLLVGDDNTDELRLN